MPIGRGKRGPGADQADKDWADLNPPRVYNDAELKNFHQKVQRFYKDKTLTTGEVIRVFDYDEFAVAFGAYTKTVVGKSVFYRAAGGPSGDTSRSTVMYALLQQYDDWRRKGDWAESKRAEDFDFMAQQMPEKELSTGVLA